MSDKSAINRYSLGDRDVIIYNKDGSLDIYIQQSIPGTGKVTNWLPTPKEGRFNLTLRLYWPKEPVLNRTWNVPPIMKVNKKNNVMRTIKSITRKTPDTSDLNRWGTISSLKTSWDSRTEIISKYIIDNTKVIEFGAGRLVLPNLIPENCVYTPSDIVDRGEGTIVLDLNKSPLPTFDNYDYAVFSGVLEYINNVPLLIKHLSEYMDSFILSYATPRKKNTRNRERNGWVNNYSEKEVIQILEQNNYVLTNKTIWRRQTIFVFKKYKVNRVDGSN